MDESRIEFKGPNPDRVMIDLPDVVNLIAACDEGNRLAVIAREERADLEKDWAEGGVTWRFKTESHAMLLAPATVEKVITSFTLELRSYECVATFRRPVESGTWKLVAWEDPNP